MESVVGRGGRGAFYPALPMFLRKGGGSGLPQGRNFNPLGEVLSNLFLPPPWGAPGGLVPPQTLILGSTVISTGVIWGV